MLNNYNIPPITVRTETSSPHVALVVAGHFKEGRVYQNWRTRGTADWLLILTLAGGGRFGYEGGEIRTVEGEVVLLRPGALHDYGTDPGKGAWELVWAHFHPPPNWLESLAWPEVSPGMMRLFLLDPAIRTKVENRLQEVHRLANGPLPNRDRFAMNALEEAILWCDTQNPQSSLVRLDTRIRRSLDYLSLHLADRVPLEELARRYGLSTSRFSHLFRAQTGVSPQQFQEHQRLARARQLLELSGRAISDIAAEVGFENPFYFTLRFKRLTGVSPRDYRKQFRLGEQVESKEKRS